MAAGGVQRLLSAGHGAARRPVRFRAADGSGHSATPSLPGGLAALTFQMSVGTRQTPSDQEPPGTAATIPTRWAWQGRAPGAAQLTRLPRTDRKCRPPRGILAEAPPRHSPRHSAGRPGLSSRRGEHPSQVEKFTEAKHGFLKACGPGGLSYGTTSCRHGTGGSRATGRDTFLEWTGVRGRCWGAGGGPGHGHPHSLMPEGTYMGLGPAGEPASISASLHLHFWPRFP